MIASFYRERVIVRFESAVQSDQEHYVKSLFNGMMDEYDNLNDLWYRYTLGYIDKVLSEEFCLLPAGEVKPVALDIGCGTGIQSLRLAGLGYKVVGVDIADELIGIARSKLKKAGYNDAEFYNVSAERLPLGNAMADCINCCGPTLSFVLNWKQSLTEMARCLKPSGKFLLEVEGKWNFDVFWEVINALGFNFLGYNESLKTALGHFRPPWNIGHYITYSFDLESGESKPMPLKLFTVAEIEGELARVGLIRDKRWGLHVVTNLIPSTILHNSNPNNLTRFIFNGLVSMEKCLNSGFPFNAFGCSILIMGHKQP